MTEKWDIVEAAEVIARHPKAAVRYKDEGEPRHLQMPRLQVRLPIPRDLMTDQALLRIVELFRLFDHPAERWTGKHSP